MSFEHPQIPSFAIDYAPLVHLSKFEHFWPSSHLEHIQNCEPVGHEPMPTLADGVQNGFALLADPKVNDENVFLTTKKDIRKKLLNVGWILSEAGRPDATGRSMSPCVVIVVDKEEQVGPGVVDVFYFFFYSFNYGPTVVDIHFGNHVADWEHCLVRFVNGAPQNVHLSAHADGVAYTYECLEKQGKRPVIYSAVGSHAMYPRVGKHDYSPVKVLGPADFTDKGDLWDPALNFRAFRYIPSPDRNLFDAYLPKDDEFVPCLQFRGQWGDKYSVAPISKTWYAKIGLSKLRRMLCLHSLRWGDGVSGPRAKTLDRKGMNQWSDTVYTSIENA